jgi:PTS system fructose-specific IIC component
MAFGATSRAPHGGIFVLFAIDNKLGFVIALLAGMVAAAAAVIFAKQFIKPGAKAAEEPAFAAA